MAQDNNIEKANLEISHHHTRLWQSFHPMDYGLSPQFRLTQFTNLNSRNFMISQEIMDEFLECFRQNENDRVLEYPFTHMSKIKICTGIDVVVVPIRQGRFSLVQAIDYIYPVVDDPFIMGKIACSDILSDLYARGVTECDNILMLLTASTKMTNKERDIVLPLMIKGFKETATEAHTAVRGGHTVINPWCSIGGVATTVCRPQELIALNDVVAGDVIVLTKPLGTHIATKAYYWMMKENKWNRLKLLITKSDVQKAYERAMDSMVRLNRTAAMLMHKYYVHGATYVTGYGILGHAQALAKNQKNEVSLVIHSLPVIAKMASVATFCGDIFRFYLGHSPETSGGLLICLPKGPAEEYCKEIFRVEGYEAWIIGVVEKGQRTARLINKPKILNIPNENKK